VSWDGHGRYMKRSASFSTTLYSDEEHSSNNDENVVTNNHYDVTSTSSSSSFPFSLFSSSFPMAKLGEQVRMVQVAYIEEQELEQEKEQEGRMKRKRRVVLDIKTGVNGQTFLTFDYRVELPISLVEQWRLAENSGSSSSNVGVGVVGEKENVDSTFNSSKEMVPKGLLGVVLRQIQNGELSEESLDLDTLRYVSLEEQEVKKRQKRNVQGLEEKEQEEEEKELLETLQQVVGVNGIVVSSVIRGGVAWELGVRVGDLLVATSATIGDVSHLCVVIVCVVCVIVIVCV